MTNRLCVSVAMAVAFVLGVVGFTRSAAAKIPVVLETDIGGDIDDTWALTMLLRSPDLDIKLVNTTDGQAEYRAKVIAKLLTVAGRTDIPVGLGEGGRTGAGGQQAWVKDYKLTDYPGKVHQDGAGALIDLIEKSPEPITVIAIGPLTTSAAALKRRPEIAPKAFFVGMDGSIHVGYNGGKPVAEWNVKANAPAARTVLSAPWRHITITPLDTCDLVKVSGERFRKLKESKDPLVQAMLENYRIWAKKKTIDQLQVSSTLFDTAAVYLAYPGSHSLMKMETLSIKVTDDGFTRIDAAGQPMSVAIAWNDLGGFHDLLIKTLLTR